MKCGPDGKLRWALCCSVLLLLAAGLRADPAAPTLKPLSSITVPPSSDPKPKPLTFGDSWRELRTQVDAWRTESARLTIELAELKTQATALSRYLTESNASLSRLEFSMDNERQIHAETVERLLDKGAAAEQSRDAWRTCALWGWGAAAIGWALAAAAMAFAR